MRGMDTTTFWEIISKAIVPGREDTEKDWFEALKRELIKLPPEEILLFRQHFDRMVDTAYKTDLWGAAYLINGGCSDDCFHYFRRWLVAQGRRVYERALKDPDTLADVLDGEDEVEDEEVGAAAARAYLTVMGQPEDWQAFYDA